MLPSPGIILWGLTCLLLFVLIGIALGQILRSTDLDGNSKLAWVLTVLFVPVIGVMLWMRDDRRR